MKKFTIGLLGAIFITLIASSVQSVTADHLEPGQGIYKDENDVNYVSTKDSKYQMYMYVTVRNTEGELVSVAETIMCQSPISWRTNCSQYLDHEITDIAFDTSFGKKEIITVDNTGHEKICNNVVRRYLCSTDSWFCSICNCRSFGTRSRNLQG